jgi:hypothetical protein
MEAAYALMDSMVIHVNCIITVTLINVWIMQHVFQQLIHLHVNVLMKDSMAHYVKIVNINFILKIKCKFKKNLMYLWTNLLLTIK